jgi:glycosyltransferase involved in cell wall biosynthesis
MINHSLIVATLGRNKELRDFLVSVEKLDYDLKRIEIIIIDQNQSDLLSDLDKSFLDLNIKIIKSNIKGLSLNRNIGLKNAIGRIISFPDDDCTLYPDTLSTVDKILEDESIGFCLGRIFDRKKMVPIIKKWPSKSNAINKLNSYFLNSSITLYLKRELLITFDENLGVGSRYGSCEDADFIYRILKNGGQGIYNPKLEVWHPSPDLERANLKKVENYASGFGYFVSKETDFTKLILLIGLLIKKMLQFFFARTPKKYFNHFFKGLIRGIIRR